MATKSKGRKLTPQEFCATYLPPNWCERDLQTYVQRVIKQRFGLGLFQPPDEVVIPTPGTKKGRRADIATWFTVYEVKTFLDYDKIYHAVAQTELYVRYGAKMLFFKKRRVIIGVAPAGEDYYSAANLKKDFSALRGIKVIFINEAPEWHLNNARSTDVNKWLLIAVVGLSVILGLVLFGVLIKK